MAAALSARINKNDKNDARGIVQMMRAGLYKEVEVKTDEACQLKVRTYEKLIKTEGFCSSLIR